MNHTERSAMYWLLEDILEEHIKSKKRLVNELNKVKRLV